MGLNLFVSVGPREPELTAGVYERRAPLSPEERGEVVLDSTKHPQVRVGALRTLVRERSQRVLGEILPQVTAEACRGAIDAAVPLIAEALTLLRADNSLHERVFAALHSALKESPDCITTFAPALCALRDKGSEAFIAELITRKDQSIFCRSVVLGIAQERSMESQGVCQALRSQMNEKASDRERIREILSRAEPETNLDRTRAALVRLMSRVRPVLDRIGLRGSRQG